MNILHVVNIFFTIPYFLGNQLLYFQNKGYSVNLICTPSDSLKSYAASHHFDYKEIPIFRKVSFFQDLKAIVLTCIYIKKKKIDIVTGHTPKGALIAMISAFIMRVPIRIYIRHGLVYETSTGVKRLLLKSMDRFAAYLSTKIICVSPSVYKKSLEDKLNSKEKQIILHKGTCNGIDLERFSNIHIDKQKTDEIRLKYNISLDDFIIGYTGRLVRDKGIIELVNAFNIAYEKYSNIKLLLVGMFEERDALPKDVIENICTNPHIINIGYIDNTCIENYYALMDIFVLPSYREGFPTSILEASSMKIPVITTKVTGCIDSIIENETGLFTTHDAKDISDAILYFRENDRQKMIYGNAGRKFVENNFSSPIIWKEIERLYHK